MPSENVPLQYLAPLSDSGPCFKIKTKTNMDELTLAAIGLERRTVALTLFRRFQIEDVVVHHIPTDMGKAVNALVGFLSRVVELHSIQYVALAKPSLANSPRLRQMHDIALDVLREHGIPSVEIDTLDLLSSYGHPPLQRKDQLRRVGRAIWPALDSRTATRCSVDAALLGLHVQAERVLNCCLGAA